MRSHDFCYASKTFHSCLGIPHRCTDFPFQINGALPQAYPNNLNHASDYACIVFIFFFTFGYSLGFGPAAWVYGSEVCKSAPRPHVLEGLQRSRSSQRPTEPVVLTLQLPVVPSVPSSLLKSGPSASKTSDRRFISSSCVSIWSAFRYVHFPGNQIASYH
jgi:hypothetical protein